MTSGYAASNALINGTDAMYAGSGGGIGTGIWVSVPTIPIAAACARVSGVSVNTWNSVS